MTHDQAIGKRIWEGDMSAIVEARKRFAADPVEQLIPWASTLYSFRRSAECARELQSLKDDLVRCGKTLRNTQQSTLEEAQNMADRADVLATCLQWIRRRPKIDARDASRLRDHIHLACHLGQKWLEQYGRTGHTWCLLELTSASEFIELKFYKAGINSLRTVEECLYTIEDVRQRARVYRKLGLLYRNMFMVVPGLWWGIAACLVPGVPLDVRKKSVAALLGVER